MCLGAATVALPLIDVNAVTKQSCAVHMLQPPAANVLNRAHPELFFAGEAQGSRRNAENRSDLRDCQRPLRQGTKSGVYSLSAEMLKF